MSVESLITDHLDIWTSAIETRSTAGRGSSNKLNLYGIKKLRELILELAVRGQLVPQDPTDEPASVLLEKIAAEKARLIKAGKLKKQQSLPPITDNEKPFELPEGWEWTRLGNITEINPRNKADDVLEVSFVPMPMILTAYDGRHEQEVKTWAEIKKGYTHFADGDIGVAKITPCFENSKAAIFSNLKNGIGAGTTELHVARPFGDNLCRNYILLYLKAPMFLSVGEDKMTGTAGQKRLPKDFFEGNPLSLPPLAEQHRIVAKVNELMSLCDALEQTQESSINDHQRLVENLLADLVNPTPNSSAWQRIVTHFDTLFTTEHSIDQLKQTILQLAVMGKLVPQDPTDEPARVLLEKIAAEKARLVKAGKLKKEKPLPPIAEDEKPFELPQGWEWCRLGDLEPEFQNGVSSRGDKNGIDVVVLRLADIKNWRISLEDTRSLTIDAESVPKYSLQKDDVLIIRVNGSADIVGRFVICGHDHDAIYCDHFIRMRFLLPVLHSGYLGILGSSDLVRANINDLFVSTAGQKTVNQKHISSLKIALPPLAEQQRVVAKVDELITLCDQLKARIRAAQTTQLHLADALAEQVV